MNRMLYSKGWSNFSGVGGYCGQNLQVNNLYTSCISTLMLVVSTSGLATVLYQIFGTDFSLCHTEPVQHGHWQHVSGKEAT